jgi:hypothetical protein
VVKGDYRIQTPGAQENEYTYSSGYLRMINDSDHVLVEGSFVTDSTRHHGNHLTAGTLEVQGNFEQKSTYNYTDATHNFLSTGTHKVLLSGSGKQTVAFEDGSTSYSYFNILEITNSSDEYVDFLTPLPVKDKLIHNPADNLNTMTVKTVDWVLNNNAGLDGDLYLEGSTLDLSGKTLTVTGNLIHSGGTLIINSGKLVVKGDYRIQTPGAQENEYTYSSGYLRMTNDSDHVLVEGNFVTDSSRNHGNYLTAGTLEVQGNFEQKSTYNFTDANYNFAATGTHKVLLSGSGKQTVIFENGSASYSCFNILEISNISDMGINFQTSVAVMQLFKHNMNHFTLSSSGDFPDYDNDGVQDHLDIDPMDPYSDTDGDMMPDFWETQNNLDPLSKKADEDPDGDGFINIKEFDAGTNPNDPNSYPIASKLIIVDNLDPGTSSVCPWESIATIDTYGADTVFTKQAGCIFTFDSISASGCQKVSLWWTRNDDHHDNVPVEIYDGITLLDIVYVDQQTGGGQWHELGIYNFKEHAVAVIVSDSNTHSTSADAVKFESDITCPVVYHLLPGWNLITLASNPDTPFTANSLAESINLQGGSVSKIQQWDGTGWQTYSTGAPFGNFAINVFNGYFVFSQVHSAWTYNGDPFSEPIEYSFETGWNLAGFPLGYSYTASELTQALNDEGGNLTKIQGWDGSGWMTYTTGAPFGDFHLFQTNGYFVFLSDPLYLILPFSE